MTEPLSMTIEDLIETSHGTAKEKGWWDPWERNIPEQLMLMVSELAEAMEEYRNDPDNLGMYFVPPNHEDNPGKPEGFVVELADCIIRIADTCGRYGINLEAALREKLLYNKSRPYRHGNKAA